MTLQIIDLLTINCNVIMAKQPSVTVIIIVAVVVFIASTVISGFAAYKIKRRCLKLQADKEKNPTAAERKE